MTIKEITVEELQEDNFDWPYVFGEGGGSNCSHDVESLDGSSIENCHRDDVVEVIAAVNGENDGDEWVGVFRLKDGRFLAASGSCDYTGWDCRAGNTLTVAASLDVILLTGLTPNQIRRLELTEEAYLPAGWEAKDGWMGPASDWWEENDKPEVAALLRQLIATA